MLLLVALIAFRDAATLECALELDLLVEFFTEIAWRQRCDSIDLLLRDTEVKVRVVSELLEFTNHVVRKSVLFPQLELLLVAVEDGKAELGEGHLEIGVVGLGVGEAAVVHVELEELF